MIYCTNCKVELTKETDCYQCKVCGYKAYSVNDIALFHPEVQEGFADYPSDGLNKLYNAEKEHFWFINRRDFIKYLFEKHLNSGSKVIEIGAGTGSIARMLMEKYDTCAGELFQYGLEYAKNYGIKELYQFDLTRAPFKEHFDAVGMFDVLEHIEDDSLALQNVHSMLKDNGKIFITVPAHMFLWNHNDVIAFHKKRYEYKQLKELLENNGFKVLELKGFFISILPLLLLRAIIKKDNDKTVNQNQDELSELEINPMINNILNTTCKIENYFLKYISLPFGGSLSVVAQKI